MRILFRTLVILLAACAVGGVVYALVGSGGSAQPARFANARPGFQPPADGTATLGAPTGDRPRGAGDRDGASLRGAGELLQTLALIAVIVAVGAPLTRRLLRASSRPAEAKTVGERAESIGEIVG